MLTLALRKKALEILTFVLDKRKSTLDFAIDIDYFRSNKQKQEFNYIQLAVKHLFNDIFFLINNLLRLQEVTKFVNS